MKKLTRAVLTLLGALFAACCGGAALQSFAIEKPAAATTSSGKVLFQLHAQGSFENAKLSEHNIVLNKSGSSHAAAVPSPNPWTLEFVNDANGNGQIDEGDELRVVQLDGVAGGVDLTTGNEYDVAMLQQEPATDAFHTPMTIVTWQSTWTAP
jgi:hypothetical protein